MTPELEYIVTLYPTPVLRKEAAPIEAFDEDLAARVAAMFRRMYASKGVGLAAPQVGLRERLLVINPSGDPEKPEEELALVNPTIIERFGPETTMEEGCLSFPGIYAEVTRPESCKVSAKSPTGEPLELEFDGFASRVIQHEYDHLQGVLLVDRMSAADKLRHRAALDELIADYKASQAPARPRGLFRH
jgi:peptide deformylase